MATLLGSLLISLGLDSGKLTSGLDASAKKMKETQAKFQAVGANMAKVGAVMTTALTAPLVALVAKSIPAAIESQQAMAQVNASLASMGPVAGRTSDQLVKMAGHLQDISLFDDDDILKSVTANLLTFGRVQGDVFDRAQAAIVDYSAKTGRDLQAATIMIAKALNDPAKGLGALQKAGLSLTEQQKDQVKAMLAVGDVAGAQRIVLGELEREYRGSAKAQRDATPGADIQQQWRTLQENIGAIAVKFLPKLNAALADALRWFNNLSPGMQDIVAGGAAIAAAIGPLTIAFGGITSAVGFVLPLLGEAGLAGILGGLAPVLGPVALAIGAAAAAWALFGDKLGPVLGQLKTELGPLWEQIKAGAAQVSQALTELWNGPFGDAMKVVIKYVGDFLAIAVKAFGSAVITEIKALAIIVSTAFTTIIDVVKGVSQFLSGDFSGAWATVRGIWDREITALGKLIDNFAPGAVAAMKNMVVGIGEWLTGKLNAIWDGVKSKIDAAAGWFKWLGDVVVHHSFIPDMVDAIGEHIARLEGNMVLPIQKATAKAADAFKTLRDNVAGILDRLFPEQAQIRDKLGELEQLGKGLAQHIISPEAFAAARKRVLDEIDQLQSDIAGKNRYNVDFSGANPGGDPDVQAITSRTAEIGLATIDAGRKVRAANDNIVESYANMASSVARSLGDLVGNIKHGDWISALESIADIVSKIAGSLSGAGVNFGGSPGAHGPNTGTAIHGARALGGPVLAGRNYIVGERGPELFSPRSSGTIVPNNALNGGGGRHITFDMRGAVVTQDLLAQMNAIAADKSITVVSEYNRRVVNKQRRRLA